MELQNADNVKWTCRHKYPFHWHGQLCGHMGHSTETENIIVTLLFLLNVFSTILSLYVVENSIQQV